MVRSSFYKTYTVVYILLFVYLGFNDNQDLFSGDSFDVGTMKDKYCVDAPFQRSPETLLIDL